MTRASRLVWFATYITFLSSLATSYVPVPFQSKRTYGFDGPWQAVVAQVGGFKNGSTASSQWTTVDLMPGGLWQNFVITKQYTQSQPNSTDAISSSNAWSPSGNQTLSGERIFYKPELDYRQSSGLYMTGQIYAQNLNIDWNEQSFTTPNTSSAAVDQGNLTLPDGTVQPLLIGFLALGGDQQLQTFPTSSTNATSVPIQAWNMPGYLYNQSIIKSFSYGLHIGSAALNYPGSLVFGGYDKGRAIGPGTVYSDHPPQLQDIVIGVETGGSPFSFGSTNGLLLDSSGARKSVPANPDPVTPYMHLSKQTCDALARHLPITFDAHSGYYLWNTSDPHYQSVVSSPSYLGFVFPPPPGYSQNITIKVPFTLLNLTLSEPAIRSGSKPYFPCRPYVPDPRNPMYILGRAFLQAAFIGREWNQHVSWLAQAPGPGSSNDGLGAAPVDIQNYQTTLQYYTDDSLFKLSWTGIWKPLPGRPPPDPSRTSNTTRHGVSLVAKIGMGIGIAVGGLLIVAVVGTWLYRRRRGGQSLETELPPDASQTFSELASPSSGVMDNDKFYEVPSRYSRFVEMEACQARRPSELPIQREPQELDSSPKHFG